MAEQSQTLDIESKGMCAEIYGRPPPYLLALWKYSLFIYSKSYEFCDNLSAIAFLHVACHTFLRMVVYFKVKATAFETFTTLQTR